MRADVPAEGDCFRRCAGAVGEHDFAMHLVQASQKRRMRGMMRHADEVRLSKVVDFFHYVEAFRDLFRAAGATTAVFPLHRPSWYSRPSCDVRLRMVTVTTPAASQAYCSSIC